MAGKSAKIVALLLCLALSPWLGAGSAAAFDWPSTGPYHLRSLDLVVGGNLLQLKAGSAMALHPDLPFSVVRASTDAWLDLGLDYRLKSHPSYDLRTPHTLRDILGDKVYIVESLELEVFKNGQAVGSVSLLVKPSSLDWLRRAEEVEALEDKIICMKKVWELTPGDAMVFQRLLGLLIEARQFNDAVEMLSAALTEKDDPALRRKLAELYMMQDKPEQAAEAWSKLLTANPDDAGLLADLAGAYEMMRRWPQAAEMLERLARTQRDAKRAATLLRAAKALKLSGKADQAIQALDQAAQADPTNPAIWHELADELGAAGNAAQRLRVLTEAAKHNPADFGLQQRLATALLEDGDHEAALEQLERLRRLKPDDPAILLKLARLYEEKDDKQALTAIYDRLSRLRPDDPNVSFNLGVLLLDAGRLDLALEKLRPAAKARPDDQDMQEALFEALAGQKKWDDAAAQAEAMFGALDPVKTAGIVYPGLAANRPERLGAMLDKAIEAKPTARSLYEMRAALAIDNDKPDQAAQVLAKAVKAFPEDPVMAMRLAEVLEAQGRDREALKVYEAILDKPGDHAEAQERYLQLKTRQLSKPTKSAK